MRCLLFVSLLVPLSTSVFESVAVGDTLNSTREQDLKETSHRVDVEVKDGLAYYTVRRVFHNSGKIADEARLQISLPYGAVATGLRIKGKTQWHDGELLPAQKAEELYVELTGLGPSEPKDPALLYWRWTDELALRVFPIFPGKSNTIEYTLTAPTSYADGTHYVTYGRKPEAKNLSTPTLRVRGKNIAAVDIDGDSSKRRVSLGPVRLHPVLRDQGIDNPKVLVRSIRVRGEKPWATIAVGVNLRHTWRGDISIALVSPEGTMHSLRKENLSDGDNNLKANFPLEFGEDPNGTWHLLVTDHHPLDGGTLKSWSLRADDKPSRVFRDTKPAFIPQPTESKAGLATIGLRLKADKSVVRLGRVDLLADKQFARLEVDVARRLSELPKPLSVSFVVDVSHTMGESGIESQLKLVEAYLSHVPWADFSLVAFGRRGKVLSGFVPAKQLEGVLAKLRKTGALKPRNGSFLDQGLAEAVPSLAKRDGTQALVMMTDDRLRPAWNNRGALATIAKLPLEAIVHVADVDTGSSFELERNDDHRLFPLASFRSGVAVNVRGLIDAKPSSVATDALYLVRPNRLDHVRIEGIGKLGETVLDSEDGDEAKGVLREGAGRRWMAPIRDAPKAVSLVGQLWSRPVRFTERSDNEPFNQATAGFVFSHDLHGDLSKTEQFVLAMYARVVSPVTSYLAIEPGVRPSTIGLEEGGTGWGTLGTGSFGLLGHGSGGTPLMDWQPVLDRVKAACASLGDGRINATLRLQSHEIADVEAGGSKDKSNDKSNNDSNNNSNKALESCVVEALWKEDIPHTGHPTEWSKRLQVRFGS